jgi:hypothetical protein
VLSDELAHTSGGPEEASYHRQADKRRLPHGFCSGTELFSMRLPSLPTHSPRIIMPEVVDKQEFRWILVVACPDFSHARAPKRSFWSASDGKCLPGKEDQPTTVALWCPTNKPEGLASQTNLCELLRSSRSQTVSCNRSKYQSSAWPDTNPQLAKRIFETCCAQYLARTTGYSQQVSKFGMASHKSPTCQTNL